jgi:hypothetical protein
LRRGVAEIVQEKRGTSQDMLYGGEMRRPLKLWFYIAIGAGRILLTAFLLLFDRGGRSLSAPRGGAQKPE